MFSVDNLVPEELNLVSGKNFSSWSSTWQSLVSGLVPTEKSSSWFSIWQKCQYCRNLLLIKTKKLNLALSLYKMAKENS